MMVSNQIVGHFPTLQKKCLMTRRDNVVKELRFLGQRLLEVGTDMHVSVNLSWMKLPYDKDRF